MPFRNKTGGEFTSTILNTDKSTVINITGDLESPEPLVVPANSTIKAVDTLQGPHLIVSKDKIGLVLLSLSRGTRLLFGFLTDPERGIQVVDPDSEIEVK